MIKRHSHTLFLSIVAYVLACCVPSVSIAKKAKDDPRRIVGYIENISIPKIDTEYKAKLDSGAATSSIHASIIELKKKEDDKEGYVIFTVNTEQGKSNHIKKPLSRIVKIKKKDGGTQRRPVVMMEFCIAGRLIEEEVNLSDRDHFNYNVLVGRNMLEKGELLIDVAQTFTALPNCPDTQDAE